MQADTFAVAATVHCLLHNEYMQVETVTDAASGASLAAPKLPLKVRPAFFLLPPVVLSPIQARWGPSLKPPPQTSPYLSPHPRPRLSDFYFSSLKSFAGCQRYWQVDLWKDFFCTLINLEGDGGAGDGNPSVRFAVSVWKDDD